MQGANVDRFRRFKDFLEHETQTSVPKPAVPGRRGTKEVEQASGNVLLEIVLLEIIDRINHLG